MINKSKYLRIIGILLIILFGISTISYVITSCVSFVDMQNVPITSIISFIATLITMLFFGPAVGTLFLVVAKLADAHDMDPVDLFKVGDKVKTLVVSTSNEDVETVLAKRSEGEIIEVQDDGDIVVKFISGHTTYTALYRPKELRKR